ncbi:unnamed protein product, partial [Tetraodon nigroviridis]
DMKNQLALQRKQKATNGLLEVHPPQKKKEGVCTHQHQDGSCDLDQGDSEPPPIKEEQEEPCCYWDREQQTVKQESEALMMTPIHEEDDRETSVSKEPDCDQQLLSNSPRVVESKDQENYNGEDSGSTPGEDLKPTVKQNKRKSHPGNANNPADSAADWNTDTGPTPATCHTESTSSLHCCRFPDLCSQLHEDCWRAAAGHSLALVTQRFSGRFPH